jgi:hypothetical protein
VVQGTIDRGKQKYAIAYAFQPGDNGVRLSYKVPYPADKATVEFTSPYAVQRVMLVVPPTVQVSSPGFAPAGTEQGFNVYTRDAVPSGSSFKVSLSGTAPPPSASPQDSGADGGSAGMPAQGQDQVNGRDSGPAIQALPNRLDSLRWILLAGFAVLFALGVLMVWRKPIPAFEGGGAAIPRQAARQSSVGGSLGGSVGPGPRAGRKPSSPAPAVPAAPAAQPASPAPQRPAEPAVAVASEIDREVEQSLDGLKDRLFRLELRRQAGTISEEEYARERNRTEQILRELVRG